MSGNNIQVFEWGQIEWIYEPDHSNSLSIMNIGITCIFPHKRQNRHIHYGDEQVIYVLSGEGIQFIGDRTTEVKPGQIYHIESGSIHETVNHGDEPIKELVISIPVYYEQNLLMEKRGFTSLDINRKGEDRIKISEEIRYIYETIIYPMKMPVSIFDMENNLIIKGRYFPEFCMSKCSVDKDICNCSVYKIKDEYGPPHYTDLSAFICPFGLTVFVMPIILNNKPIGVIKGGHIRTSSLIPDTNNNTHFHEVDLEALRNQIQIVPKGTLNAILQQLKKLSKTIGNYYIFKNTEVELNKKEEIIQDIVKNEVTLEKSLKSTRDKVLNIQINNHFLFNTLNAIAGLALKESSLNTYNAIINLSKMLRYTMTSQNYFAQFKEEVKYLENYISLQELRYGEKLKVNFDISSDIENKNIPFNCLQPIVENCFTHGFKDMKRDMKINIWGRIEGENLIIEIRDNGVGLGEEKLSELRNKIDKCDSHELSGLTMICSKLKLLYGSNSKFTIENSQNGGTRVRMFMPEYRNKIQASFGGD